VAELLACPVVARAERVYLMTTNSAGFYGRLGFSTSHAQHLMVWHRQQQSSG
jgi:N-acetylglutamate synthase-like GNAT family acetyltransferase